MLGDLASPGGTVRALPWAGTGVSGQLWAETGHGSCRVWQGEPPSVPGLALYASPFVLPGCKWGITNLAVLRRSW